MNVDRAIHNDDFPYLDAFVNSVRDVLHTMAFMDAEYVGVRDARECVAPDNVEAAMPVSGQTVGIIAVTAEKNLAARVVSRIVGKNPEDLEKSDVDDGIAEVTNMIAGAAKARLAGTPYHFALSSPLPRRVRDLRLQSNPDMTAPALVFDVDGQRLAVIASLSPEGQKRSEI